LERALAGRPLLRSAGRDEPAPVEVLVGPDGGLTVADRVGPLHAPRPGGPSGIARVVEDLHALARTAALRGLAVDRRWALNAPVTFEWGVVRDRLPQRLPEAGAVVAAGTPIYIRVRNDGPGATVFATLVDIGVAGRITVLTDFAGPGVRLEPGTEYIYGFDDNTGVLGGQALGWPEGLEPSQARPETVMLFVTSEPQDFSALSQDGVRGGANAEESPLTAVLRQIATGRTRDLHAADGPVGRFDARTLDFELSRASDA
jgi:hypothetical protein